MNFRPSIWQWKRKLEYIN